MKIFAVKSAEVTERWRKVDNQELDNLYCLSNIKHQVKDDLIGKACGMNGRQKKCIHDFGCET